MQNQFEQFISWAENTGSLGGLCFAGATQRGRSWSHDNNQDAYAIVSAPTAFVGAICDGCSTAPSGHQSHNEVGAKIQSKLISQYVAQVIRTSTVEQFLLDFSWHKQRVLEVLSTTVDALCPFGDKDLFVKCYMMSTILVVATDGKDYCIFGCGDGLIIINGEKTDLEEEGGRYLSSNIIRERGQSDHPNDCLKIHKCGALSEIRSMMIASDGIADVATEHTDILARFLSALAVRDSPYDIVPGYRMEIIQAFRRTVLKDSKYNVWSNSQDNYDDRTFLVLENYAHVEGKTIKNEEIIQSPILQVETMAAEFTGIRVQSAVQQLESPLPLLIPTSPMNTPELTDQTYVEQKRRKFVELHRAGGSINTPRSPDQSTDGLAECSEGTNDGADLAAPTQRSGLEVSVPLTSAEDTSSVPISSSVGSQEPNTAKARSRQKGNTRGKRKEKSTG